MESIKLLRAILPEVLIDNFDVVKFDKTSTRFDIFLDEKKVMMREDKRNSPLYLMVLMNIVPFKTFQFVVGQLIYMSASVNG